LRFYSKFVVLALVFVACAPAYKPGAKRADKPRPVTTKPIKLEGRELNSQELINLFFTSPQVQSACERLNSVPRANTSQERFRILESASVYPGPNIGPDGNIKKKDCTFICVNPRHWGSERCRLCQEEPLDLVDVWGRVGIGTHPLYEIAMQSVQLPTRDEFMNLVEKERSKYGLVMWPFFETYRSLIKLGIKDAIEMRNQIIEERVDQAFPGAFTYDGKTSKMEESLSLALVLNALPNYSSLLILPYDSEKEKSRKRGVMKQLEAVLSKPMAYFQTSSWSDFSNDALASINASVRSLQGSDSIQHACAMALMHRNFAQMIRIIGYARLPVSTNSSGNTHFQVPFSQMLDTPSGTRLRTCPAPGSFVRKDGTRLMLNEKQIGGYARSGETIQISGRIEPLRRCSAGEAKLYDVKGSERIAFGKSSARATAEDNLALMRVLSHQLTAFNPGSDWWAKSPAGFPLGEFEDFETIEKGGAVLPYQYHALALGLMQIVVDSILKNHLVQVDSDFKETKRAADVVGIRVSSTPRTAGSSAQVETSIESALMMAEVAFKAGAYLKQLPIWQSNQARYYNSEFSRLRTNLEKFNYSRANVNFVDGLFGGLDNLKLLVGQSKLPNGATAQSQVDQLKTASALLLATFAVQAPTSTATNPLYTCATKVVTKPKGGGEVKTGQCNAAQEKAWKKTFSWLSKIYQSPLFATYSK
jgi:hypothetical protein